MTKRMPTWNAFKAKYDSEEEQHARFEDLARCLFCERFKVRGGLFQYINHPGNETEPIERDGKVIGFQAKYFSTKIDTQQILDSIKAIRSFYSNQTDLIIYTNLAFGFGKNSNLKPGSQNKIEDKAKACGLNLEWVNDKMILDQVAKIDWIYDVFFSPGIGLDTLIHEEQKNTESILRPIYSEIAFKGQSLKIDRSNVINQFVKEISPHNHFIIHGDGGTGKTALIKELTNLLKDKIPVCIRRAQSLDAHDTSEFLKLTHHFSETQFKAAYETEDRKVFIIDSAERVQEIENIETLISFIKFLEEAGWTIIFTVRNLFLSDLRDEMKYSCHIHPQTIQIDEISEESLKEISTKNNFKLPQAQNYQELLRILFYLNLYLSLYNDIDISATENEFFELIWKEKIKGKSSTRGSALKREDCFREIINRRINSGVHFISQSNLNHEALQELINDEVIASNQNGYLYITHDIYEEWGINRIISQKWCHKLNISDFFHKIGHSYLVRRIFRQWLSNKIKENISQVKALVDFDKNIEIPEIWKDEIIISILSSPYCSTFLQESTYILFNENAKLLKRVLFLLQLACKRFDRMIPYKGEEYPIFIPNGHAWQDVINYLYINDKSILSLPYLIDVLYEWTIYNNPLDITTTQAGRLALRLWSRTENRDTFFLDEENNQKLAYIICQASSEIKSELNTLIDRIVSKNWTHSNDPYYYLSIYILSQTTFAKRLIHSIPEAVRKLSKAFWTAEYIHPNEEWEYESSYYECQKFGLRNIDIRNDYNPAGAHQTPIYELLLSDFKPTLKFIVDFVNYSIEHLNKKETGLASVTIHLPNGNKREQFGAECIWELYRGAVNLHTPYILQSIHMALEKFLLDLMSYGRKDIVKYSFDFLLRKSKSVSLTAVISSIVMAYPDEFWEYALTLFKSIEFFDYDNTRRTNETQYTSFWAFAVTKNQEDVISERIEASKMDFRKNSLEGLCSKFQYFGVKNLSEKKNNELINTIYSILDEHYKTVATSMCDRDALSIMLHRIDRRKHQPKILEGEKDGEFIIKLQPQLPTHLKQESERAQNNFEKCFRYSPLDIWSSKRLRNEDVTFYKDFENDPHVAVVLIRELVASIKKGDFVMPMVKCAQYKAAGILIRDFSDVLSFEDLNFCTNLVEERVNYGISSQYFPQISDGLEHCVHALPTLIELFPDKKELYKDYFSRLLLNRTPLGAYKRVCDYAIETIHEGKLWYRFPDFSREIFYDFKITLHKGAKLVNDKKSGLNVISKTIAMINEILHTVSLGGQRKPEKIFSYKLSDDIVSIGTDIEGMEILLELIPSDTTDLHLCNIVVENIVPTIIDSLTKNRNYKMRYHRHIHFYEAYAKYALNRSDADISSLILPVSQLIGDKNKEVDIYNCEYFIRQFIKEGYETKTKDNFWAVWNILYPSIVINENWRSKRLLREYMLSYSLWLTDIHDWNGLRKKDLWLYSRLAKDCGDLPIVLSSIAKLLEGIGQQWREEGLDWIYEIVATHPNLELQDEEKNTLFYLERILNKFIRQNRIRLKQDNDFRFKIMTILSFMVERNSTQAYMLRELIA